ncbi:MAG: Crp/Fnr family transcriptional regulator [Chitinophagales bacterium]|nr:Crp/Fnr family transcriptional regulator [Chitinophagales bacterium]
MEKPEIKYWYLRNHQLFSTLSNAEISKLCIITRYKTPVKGDNILLGEHDRSRIFFLKSGLVSIMEESGGKETIKDIIHKGDLFGEMSLGQSQGNSREYAKVMSPKAVICTFYTEDFEKVMEANPKLALHYTKIVGLKLNKLSNKYTNLVFKDVRTRLLEWLHQWALETGVEEDDYYRIDNYLTHNDIAKIICATRQTVSEILSELEAAGKIKYNRKEILLAKKDFLSATVA